MPPINGKRPDRTAELIRTLRGHQRLLLLTHANPDPDSLAAAVGLQLLAGARLDMPSELAIAGRIMRAENREMVRSCAIRTRLQSEVGVDAFDCLALVDTQPGFGHTHLPRGRRIDIVVDHHVPPAADADVECVPAFCDVRTDVGATSSIVTSYLMDEGIEIPPQVATALVYGISTDTADLTRNVSPLDEEAYAFLAPKVDRAALRRIITPQLAPDYYRTLREALGNVRIYDEVVLCSLGKVAAPEMVAEVADLLVRMEGEQTVYCGGLVDSVYHVSVRTDSNRDAYGLLGAALDGLLKTNDEEDISFGGHGALAGGFVRLPDDSPKTLKRLERMFERNILKSWGREQMSCRTIGARVE